MPPNLHRSVELQTSHVESSGVHVQDANRIHRYWTVLHFYTVRLFFIAAHIDSIITEETQK